MGNSDVMSKAQYLGQNEGGYNCAYTSYGTININASNTSSGGTTYAVGDYIGCAKDLDSTQNKVYWYKNGVLMNSGGTDITNQLYAPAGSQYSNTGSWRFNFGNGYFQTTAVSSNSGNGYSATGSLGIFQYQPPTGYTALCTKGLNL